MCVPMRKEKPFSLRLHDNAKEGSDNGPTTQRYFCQIVCRPTSVHLMSIFFGDHKIEGKYPNTEIEAAH